VDEVIDMSNHDFNLQAYLFE